MHTIKSKIRLLLLMQYGHNQERKYQQKGYGYAQEGDPAKIGDKKEKKQTQKTGYLPFI